MYDSETGKIVGQIKFAFHSIKNDRLNENTERDETTNIIITLYRVNKIDTYSNCLYVAPFNNIFIDVPFFYKRLFTQRVHNLIKKKKNVFRYNSTTR